MTVPRLIHGASSVPATPRIVRVVLLCVIVSIAACGTGDPASPGVPVRLKVVVLPFLSWAPFHIAAEEGYFAEQDLEVELVKLNRNSEAIPALARGAVDVGAGLLTVGILNAIGDGARIRLVADKGHLAAIGCTSNALIARRSLVETGKLDDPAQLLGRRVDLDVLLPEGYYVDRLLRMAGLTLDDLEIVNVPPPADVEALTSGAIDLTVATEPDVTRLLESGDAVVWRSAEQVIPGFQWASVLYGSSLLDDRPEVGERFMVAYLKAVRQYNRGKTPRNLDILSRRTGLSQKLLGAACWPSLRDDGRVDTRGLLAFQEWAMSRRLLDRLVAEDELVDHRFVERANVLLDSSLGARRFEDVPVTLETAGDLKWNEPAVAGEIKWGIRGLLEGEVRRSLWMSN